MSNSITSAKANHLTGVVKCDSYLYLNYLSKFYEPKPISSKFDKNQLQNEEK